MRTVEFGPLVAREQAMNYQKKPVKKLSLNKETIRNISERGQQHMMKAPDTSPRCTAYTCPSDVECPTDLCG
jgi:hypothetical protein